MSDARGWILAETNWKSIRDTRCDVAVLPWGSTEAHNFHLPYATDTIQASEVAAESARIAAARGARVMVLPPIPYGVQTGQLDIPFCINMNPSTLAAVLGDIAASLEPHGVKALVILNGHGGNDFRTPIRELQPRFRMLLSTLNWWACLNPRVYFDEPGDHAGEMETSVVMHVRPDLVRPLDEAGPGSARPFRVGAFREGWAWAMREWTRVTDDTGVGDPRAATAAKGATFMSDACERIATFLGELAALDRDDMYDDASR